MKCPFCEKEMIWMDDFDLEDISIDEEKGTVQRYICSNNECNCDAEFTLREGKING